MDEKLSDVLAMLAPCPPEVPSDEPDASECKCAIAALRKHVDNGWLFINYNRRLDKSNGQPVGCAIAFFIDGQLYAGASVCRIAPPAPPRVVRAAAKDLLDAIEENFGVKAAAMAEAVHLKRLVNANYDPWRRHVGLWKAVEHARPLDNSVAAALSRMADAIYTKHKDDIEAAAAAGKRPPAMPKMSNLMSQLATSNSLPPVFSTSSCFGMAGWLHETAGNTRAVPFRVCGTIVGVICGAIRVKIKRDAASAAAGEQKPVPAGV